MFDRLKAFLKKYVFWEGVVVGVLLCHACYNQFLIGRIKDGHAAEMKVTEAELRSEKQTTAQLQKEIQRREDYEQKFHVEAVARASADRKLAELQADYSIMDARYNNLLGRKWEEKYNAEKLARVAANEELAILKTRLVSANEQVPKSDPYLVKQLEVLTEQNTILTKERDELRKLYTTSVSQYAPTNVVTARSTTTDNRGKGLLASLSGVPETDVAAAIIEGVRTWGGPVDGQTFIAMLSKAWLPDRSKVVTTCAPYLARPLTEAQVESISHLLWAPEAGDAMSVLMKEQMKK
jgi:hypothetical protein